MCKHILRNLHGIEGGAFLYLVTNKPECHTAWIGQIGTKTADIDGILSCRIKGHRIFFVGR